MRMVRRLKNRAQREAQRLVLRTLHQRAGGDLFIDYGWGGLIYTNDGDSQEVLYHLNQKKWRRQDMAAFELLISEGDTVVDVGANMGFVTLILASLVGPSGTVIALEPSTRSYEKLTRTVERNGLADVVTALNVGCGAQAARVMLRQVSDSSGNATILSDDGDSEEIVLTRLDDLDVSDVDLIKIDTEGFEPEVLKGAARLLEMHRPVIYVELGGHYLDSTLEAVGLLAEFGYDTRELQCIDWFSVGNGANFVVKSRI